MNTIKEIYEKLCELAPLSLQLPYDNSGFLVGRADIPVHNVLLSLDITGEVIEEAQERGAELIISHHPAIWDPLKHVTDQDVDTEKILRLLEKNLSVISMHTNLDIARGGVNDVLLSLLGGRNGCCFEEENCGRMGYLEKAVSMQNFLLLCKERLQTNGLRYYDAERPVEKIAVLGGSGGGKLLDAYRAGCDTFVTADVKYSVFLLAREVGMNLIDGDHFCTENPVMYVLADKLRAAFPDIRFAVSSRHTQTARFI